MEFNMSAFGKSETVLSNNINNNNNNNDIIPFHLCQCRLSEDKKIDSRFAKQKHLNHVFLFKLFI